MTDQIKKKRGRKPKHLVLNTLKPNTILEEPTKSEDENVILHLPINIDEINNSNDMSIFIKSEENLNNTESETLKQSEQKMEIKTETKADIKTELKTDINILSNSVHKI